jgi:hypothetical protein
MNAIFSPHILSVECFKPADFPTLSVRDGNFTSSHNIRPTLVVEYGVCGREDVPFVDQGAAVRNSIIRSKIRPLIIRQEDTGVAKEHHWLEILQLFRVRLSKCNLFCLPFPGTLSPKLGV